MRVLSTALLAHCLVICTCRKRGDVCAVRIHPGDCSKVQVVSADSWWNANVEWGSQIEVDQVVRPNSQVVVAMITRKPKIWQDDCWRGEVLQQQATGELGVIVSFVL